jgi:tetratricopeptide (TPR) repeat protein
MVETINVVCPGCKKTFAVPLEYEDRKVKCKCGQVFIAAKKLTEPKEPVSIESALRKPSQNKSVIVLSVIIVLLTLILSVFLMWLFVFRDKWENDNRLKIQQTSDLVISLIQSGKLEQGIAKYEELQTFVKNRRIKNPELRKVLSNAQKAFGEAKFRLEEADKLVKLQTLEYRAKSFIENGDLQNGIAKYQEALDFIKKNQTNNPKFTETMGRISVAKREATELIEKVNRKIEEEQKLEEEKKRLANMRATVSGGAWLTRKSGSSEPVRGLRIVVLKSQGKNYHLLAILQAYLEFEKLSLEISPENDEKNQESISNLQEEIITISRDRFADVDISKIRIQYKFYDTLAKLNKELAEYDLKEKQGEKWIALNKAYMKIRIPWEAICLEQAVGSTHTDVDGKYRIEIPVGSYYLYAAFESEYSSVDWFIPLQVLSNEEIKVDFHNENAFWIDNKDTLP